MEDIFSKKVEIFAATGENIRNIKLFLNSLKIIPPTSVELELLNTSEQLQYLSSLFLKIIPEKCLKLIIAVSYFKNHKKVFVNSISLKIYLLTVK